MTTPTTAKAAQDDDCYAFYLGRGTARRASAGPLFVDADGRHCPDCEAASVYGKLEPRKDHRT